MQQASQATQQFVATTAQLQETSAWYDRTMASANSLRAAIDTLRADVQQATADYKAGVISLGDYNTAISVARQSALSLRTAGGLNPSEISALNSVLVQTAPAAEAAAGGLGRLTLASGMMASSAMGGSFMLGRVLASIGALGIGAPEVIGILAGIAAIVEIFKLSTKAADDYQKALDADVKKLDELAKSKLPPHIQEVLLSGRGQEQIDNLQAQLTAAQQALNDAIIGAHAASLGQGGPGGAVEAVAVERVQKAQEAVNQLQQAIVQLNDALQQVANGTGAEELTKINNTILKPDIVLFGHQWHSLAEEMRAAGEAAAALHIQLQFPPENVDAGIAGMNAALEQGISDMKAWEKALEEFEKAKERAGMALSREKQMELAQLGIDPGQFLTDTQRTGTQAEGAAGQAREAGAEARKAAKEITDETRKQMREMEEIGRSAIHQLVDGLMHGTLDMGKIVEGIIAKFVEDNITKALFGALGIASPSKVGIEAGQYVAQGLALGITGTPAMQSLGDLRLRLDVNTGSMPAAMTPFDAARDAGWQRIFRESSLVANQGGFRVPA